MAVILAVWEDYEGERRRFAKGFFTTGSQHLRLLHHQPALPKGSASMEWTSLRLKLLGGNGGEYSTVSFSFPQQHSVINAYITPTLRLLL